MIIIAVHGCKTIPEHVSIEATRWTTQILYFPPNRTTTKGVTAMTMLCCKTPIHAFLKMQIQPPKRNREGDALANTDACHPNNTNPKMRNPQGDALDNTDARLPS